MYRLLLIERQRWGSCQYLLVEISVFCSVSVLRSESETSIMGSPALRVSRENRDFGQGRTVTRSDPCRVRRCA